MAATIVGFALGEPILRLLNGAFLQLGLAGGEFLLLPFCYGWLRVCLSTIGMREAPRKTGTSAFSKRSEKGCRCW